MRDSGTPCSHSRTSSCRLQTSAEYRYATTDRPTDRRLGSKKVCAAPPLCLLLSFPFFSAPRRGEQRGHRPIDRLRVFPVFFVLHTHRPFFAGSIFSFARAAERCLVTSEYAHRKTEEPTRLCRVRVATSRGRASVAEWIKKVTRRDDFPNDPLRRKRSRIRLFSFLDVCTLASSRDSHHPSQRSGYHAGGATNASHGRLVLCGTLLVTARDASTSASGIFRLHSRTSGRRPVPTR